MLVRPAPILAPLTTFVLLAGCAPTAPGRQDPPPDRAADPTVAITGSVDPDGTDTPEEFEKDIRGSQLIAEQYWEQRLGGSFQAIRQVIPYERDGEVDCAGQPLPRNNAVYCSAGDFIAYDVNWAFAAFQQIGDAFVYYLLGHEYAHGVQARLGIRKEFTIEQELQADCMAGAFIGDMARQQVLTMQDGDTQELADGLAAVGDDPGQPWFAPGSHGTPQQRFQSFADGYENSLAACNL
ncbi:neutral zinc metallopeptidase [Actinoplanes couchii]|uniref:Neutral zinc metallopeptidase n=1 Tax=Actinoplanes couchii TaxID=403638 RepID=A0ABQ3X0Z5_9ACTN|nr:neutral zinc metallopeptidase [Actinoplanes couchii]MDR6316537.1 putative metalloprotease [Actinoplanes couchii]GID52151.1 neutral zinc metallopeptidase [Actinoplanes couchii]